jgi:hypothetical protein
MDESFKYLVEHAENRDRSVVIGQLLITRFVIRGHTSKLENPAQKRC